LFDDNDKVTSPWIFGEEFICIMFERKKLTSTERVQYFSLASSCTMLAGIKFKEQLKVKISLQIEDITFLR
jgi:hypothetical protein